MRFNVEVRAPDISPYKKGNIGLNYVHRFNSGKAGPHLLITAVVHGNEICGAIALDFLLRNAIMPKIGVLTLCFANADAYQQFNPERPYLGRYQDEDMNRVWSDNRLKNGPNSRELTRARELCSIVKSADVLLDLHSMAGDCQPLALPGRLAKGVQLAQAVGLAPYIVMDEGHAAGKRLRDFAPYGDRSDPRASLLMECGQHWKEDTAIFAINTSLRMLLALRMIELEDVIPWLTLSRVSGEHVLDVTHTVTVENDAFYFTRSVQTMERIERAGTELGLDGKYPVVTPYDNCFLIMPQPGAPKGNTAVRMARSVSASLQ